MSVALSSLSQSYTFRHYQVEDGLSYNSVICSLQDQKGFLWFGTKDGLNRFDGYSFKIFRNDPDNSTSIGSNYIHCLYEDKNQEMWVGTLTGLYKYNAFEEQFSLIIPSKGKDIRDIKIDHKENIWYIAGLTLCRYNEHTKRLKIFEPKMSGGFTSLTITANDEVWVSTANGFIQKYNQEKDDFESYNVFNKSKPTISTWIEKLYDTGKEFLLIGTSNQGIKSFDLKTKTYKDILSVNSDQAAIHVRDFIAKNSEEYWIATESGVYIYNIRTGKNLNLRNKSNNPYSIADNAVYTLTKDKEGGIWVGTYFGGINYYPNPYTSFEKFFPQYGTNSLSGYAVREICKDVEGNIWIGTEDAGLNKLNHLTGVFEQFKPTDNGASISHTNIHGLLVVDDKLWIGTFEHGLDVMDIKTSKVVKHYRAGPAPNHLKSNFIVSLLKTRSGDLLIGTSFGLYRYNKVGDDFTLINEFPGNLHYASLLEDKQGTIWASTLRDGLYFHNPINKTSGYYKHEENNRKSLSSNAINSVFIDSKDRLWVATENGLNKVQNETRNFERYNSKNGFLSNVFYKILEDEKNNLWISTSRGLACFNPTNNSIKSYTKANGLLSDQFNYSSAFKDTNGRMYFGSVKGLISFLPDQFSQNKYIPPVYITGFQVYNKELAIGKKNSTLNRSISFTDEIRLSHQQSTFSIDFAALGYTAAQMTEYAFKMEGLDKNWTYLKTNRKVYFTNLLSGTYIFKLKATNSSGLWNDQLTTLKIIIDPPIWASPLALLLYVLIIAIGIYYLIRYYHQRLSNRNKLQIEILAAKKEKELYDAKIEFFTYVTHEIRTPLTLIKGPLEDLIKKVEEMPAIGGDLLIMEKNTNRLIALTDQLLDFRKTEIKGFNLNFIKTNVTELIKENCLRYRSAIEQKGLFLKVELPEETLDAYADPEALTKILSNLIDNAVKYTSSQISIMLLIDEDTFNIVVKSDGALIPTDRYENIFEPFYRMENNKEKGTGIGLPLARSLAELHEGTLQLRNEKIWNVFSLVLPKHQERAFKLNEKPTEEKQPTNEGLHEHRHFDSPLILLVEDNLEISAFIADKLKSFRVIQTSNGKEALDVLAKKSIHLIISDVTMPLMDGYELCKAVKDNLEYAHIPIILLTAKNTLQSKIEGLELGADAYLEKPFSPDHLLTQISNLLTGRNKLKNYFASSPLVHIKNIAYNKADEAFLETLYQAIHKNMDNKSLDVDLLAEIMHMSRPTLYRKIKAISNLSPHELINITRLKRAAELLAEGNHKILKIATMTGFSSQAQFGRSFVKQFRITPSDYAASKSIVNIDDESISNIH